MEQNEPKKVFVGLSGGVDSSVAAALLKERGFSVTGIFLKCWSPEFAGFLSPAECPWEKDQEDAKAVADVLGIPFRSLNLEQEYWERVTKPTIDGYAKGNTPNPDVLCNKEIKFGLFYDYAVANGADFVATGHYVRLSSEGKLCAAKDESKDQSYFLWEIEPEKLSRCLFPIGDYTKTEVRDLARKFGLPTAEKPDSQGICFVGNVPIREFLQHYIKSTPGAVVTTDGAVVGTHEGAAFYTVGQRRGVGVFGATAPYYVKDKDMSTNTVIVVPPSDIVELYKDHVWATDVNWSSGASPALPCECKAQIRYRQVPQVCTIVEARAGSFRVVFEKSQRAIAEGQSIVFFKDDIMLGGGIMRCSLE